MKSSAFRHLLVLAAAGALLAPFARAEEANKTVAKFSDAAKPGTLRVDLPFADIRITGADTAEVTVASTMPEKGKAEVDRDGFRRLDDEATFEVTEKNNVLSVTLTGQDRWHGHGSDFVITVPRNTNIIVEGDNHGGGDLVITGVEGDVDVSSMNGDVELRDLVGSAVVNSMNGEILAYFKTAPVKPVSLVSMNGEIDLRLPADTKANLKMSSFHGSIRTNFGSDILKSKTESAGAGFSRSTHSPRSAEVRAAAEAVRANAERLKETASELREKAKELAEKDAEASRIAEEVSRSVSREVSREVARSVREAVAVAPRAPRQPRIPSIGGKTVTGTLNGGGVDITLSSMNGTITVRQIK